MKFFIYVEAHSMTLCMRVNFYEATTSMPAEVQFWTAFNHESAYTAAITRSVLLHLLMVAGLLV